MTRIAIPLTNIRAVKTSNDLTASGFASLSMLRTPSFEPQVAKSKWRNRGRILPLRSIASSFHRHSCAGMIVRLVSTAGMNARPEHNKEIPQYRLRKILVIWAAAAIPMGLLGWVVAPALATNSNQPGFERLAVLTAGLVWQFVIVVYLLYDE